jgi:hypothetical protein
LQAREFIPAGRTHARELDAHGHVLAIRLDPVPPTVGVSPKPWWPQRSLVVTAAYVPPPSKRWGLKREPIFQIIDDIDLSIQKLRRTDDVFPLTMAHTNAPDNACEVPLVLRQPKPVEEVQSHLATAAARRQTLTRLGRIMASFNIDCQ